jgi:hypothetical protein
MKSFFKGHIGEDVTEIFGEHCIDKGGWESD